MSSLVEDDVGGLRHAVDREIDVVPRLLVGRRWGGEPRHEAAAREVDAALDALRTGSEVAFDRGPAVGAHQRTLLRKFHGPSVGLVGEGANLAVQNGWAKAEGVDSLV